MSKKKLGKFIEWAKNRSFRRGLICHLYIRESEKQYYDKTDYAYLNLFSDSPYWVVKGTANHGIRRKKGKCSPIPCLNCFQVNDKFFRAIKILAQGKSHIFFVFPVGPEDFVPPATPNASRSGARGCARHFSSMSPPPGRFHHPQDAADILPLQSPADGRSLPLGPPLFDPLF